MNNIKKEKYYQNTKNAMPHSIVRKFIDLQKKKLVMQLILVVVQVEILYF